MIGFCGLLLVYVFLGVWVHGGRFSLGRGFMVFWWWSFVGFCLVLFSWCLDPFGWGSWYGCVFMVVGFRGAF